MIKNGVTQVAFKNNNGKKQSWRGQCLNSNRQTLEMLIFFMFTKKDVTFFHMGSQINVIYEER